MASLLSIGVFLAPSVNSPFTTYDQLGKLLEAGTLKLLTFNGSGSMEFFHPTYEQVLAYSIQTSEKGFFFIIFLTIVILRNLAEK